MTVYDDKTTLPRESSTQCNYSDIFMSHADICRSNGPENKLTSCSRPDKFIWRIYWYIPS